MKKEFLERLYRGYAAEHYVSSQLFRHGFEVFRLPADFGLDLVVTNQFQVAKKALEGKEGFPFALQVKSRWLRPEDVKLNEWGRPVAIFSYRLKLDEVSLMVEAGNAGVAFVFYWPAASGAIPSPYLFWLHASYLPELIKLGFLRLVEVKSADPWRAAKGVTEQRYVLTVRYTMMPQQTRAEFIKELEGSFKLEPRLKARLEKALPTVFLKNWKASPYLALGRKDRTGGSDLVFKTPAFVGFDFEAFPAYASFQDPG